MFIANPLNESRFAFPVLESLHLVSIFCGVGTAALMNLRLLGVGIMSVGPAKLWHDTKSLTHSGLGFAILFGLLLFSIDPEKYYNNQAFRFKMVALLVALGFYFTVVYRAAGKDRTAPVIAVVSLGLFALVPLGGIFIGYE